MALKKKVANTVAEASNGNNSTISVTSTDNGKFPFIILSTNPEHWLRFDKQFVWKSVGEGENKQKFNISWIFSHASIEDVTLAGTKYTIEGGDSFNDPFFDFGLHNPPQAINATGSKFTPKNLKTFVYIPVIWDFEVDDDKMYDGESGTICMLEIPLSHVSKITEALKVAKDEFEDGERRTLYGNTSTVSKETTLDGRTIVLTHDKKLKPIDQYKYTVTPSSISKNVEAAITRVPKLVYDKSDQVAKYNAAWKIAVVDEAMKQDKDFANTVNAYEFPKHKLFAFDDATEILDGDVLEEIVKTEIRKPFLEALNTDNWEEVVDFFYSGTEERVTATSASQATVTEPEGEELHPF